MPSYSQIQAQIEKLQKEAEALRKRELSETIAKIKKAIQTFGLTAQDLGLSSPTKPSGRRGRPAGRKKPGPKAAKKTAAKGKLDKRSVVAPKYRDPATGTTWTGRGKQPKWLAAALQSGRTLDSFRI